MIRVNSENMSGIYKPFVLIKLLFNISAQMRHLSPHHSCIMRALPLVRALQKIHYGFQIENKFCKFLLPPRQINEPLLLLVLPTA